VKATKNEDPNVFLDLLGKNDLAVIIGKSGSSRATEEESRPQKKYLVVTLIAGDHKVHYPLPLSIVEASQPHLVDRDTMKMMISNMARILQESASKSSFNQS
jgi:hypothetical protein